MIILSGGVGGFFYVRRELFVPLSQGTEEKYFEIKQGESVKEIANSLKSAGFIRNPWVFIGYLTYKGTTGKLIAGDYILRENMTLVEIAAALTSGKTAQKRITIPEGWTVKEIAEYLDKNEIVKQEDFLLATKKNYNFDFLKDKPQNKDPSGYLFPDTYNLSYNVTVDEIVLKMLENFDRKLDSNLRQEIKNSGKTIFEVLTMASIVEKEVSKDEDRAKVAGIFYKRIENNMKLEADATISFITGKNDPQSSYEDTQINSPFNTYLYPGLPPGPICNPGLSAIKAAIYPKETNYWFYLSRQDTGETIFSETYEEHLQAKEIYLD